MKLQNKMWLILKLMSKENIFLFRSFIEDLDICFYFKNENERLYLEFYNSGEIGYISENIKTKKILENKDITITEIIPTLKEFLNLK